MAPSVRLSLRAAELILAQSGGAGQDGGPFAELRRAVARVAPKRKPSRKRSAPNAAFWKFIDAARKPSSKKELARARRQDIRTAVFLRAGGVCECGCGGQLWEVSDIPDARGEFDHFFGRGKGRLAESEQTCWALRADCHRQKTLNRPDAATWLLKFADHADRHGFLKEAFHARSRLAFVETRSKLPASPRLR